MRFTLRDLLAAICLVALSISAGIGLYRLGTLTPGIWILPLLFAIPVSILALLLVRFAVGAIKRIANRD